MTEPKTEPEAQRIARSEEESCCGGIRTGRALGLALLGAAIVIPTALYYLSKHLWSGTRNSLEGRRETSSSAHPGSPIRIPVQPATMTEEVEGKEPSAEEPTKVAEPPEVGPATGSGEATPAPFVGSADRDKFHLPDCRWAQNIDPDNLVTFPSREAALERGYIPCNTCKP